MTSTKHTPGSWVINPFVAQVDAFNDEGPAPVCKMLWPTDLRSEAETEANARLIAAAPEMLAALEYIAWGREKPTPEEQARDIANAVRFMAGRPAYPVDRVVAMAALAKARGETP